MNDPLDRMSCEEAFRRLDDYLDRELSPDEMRQVEEHLRVCEVCTGEFVFEASVLTGVRGKLQSIAAPPDLLARIAARLPPPED
ncbi:MAG TPA: anti-sigma factor [Gemmatimonadales bacterium]|jgi:anti-sigma factor (TIGR02949 family)